MVKIGYTTGVFDLFHIGHLNILRNAKLECDYLIVGITTDELAKKEKGRMPIIPFSERMTIVESIKHVDSVIPQVNYDKIEAWNNLKFNIMFVGDDWQGTEKWNMFEEKFLELGVKISYFPYTKHTSSSRIRKILDFIYEDNK
jgi:glycerol-3-phosphate cytidylyltransferase